MVVLEELHWSAHRSHVHEPDWSGHGHWHWVATVNSETADVADQAWMAHGVIAVYWRETGNAKKAVVVRRGDGAQVVHYHWRLLVVEELDAEQ